MFKPNLGSLVTIIKKLVSRQIIQRIPKSNILLQSKNNQEQSIEMATLHSTPRIIKVGLTYKKTNKNLTLLNNSKHNKNIIKSYGLFIICVIFCIFSVLITLFRFGWISQSNVIYHLHHSAVLLLSYPLSIS